MTWTTDAGEALDGAAYVLSSGGAPRREGMTREDLLRGNAEIAAQLGRDISQHAPDARLVVIVFNPADITGLVTLVHSGLAPQHVTTLAALDSTRLADTPGAALRRAAALGVRLQHLRRARPGDGALQGCDRRSTGCR